MGFREAIWALSGTLALSPEHSGNRIRIASTCSTLSARHYRVASHHQASLKDTVTERPVLCPAPSPRHPEPSLHAVRQRPPTASVLSPLLLMCLRERCSHMPSQVAAFQSTEPSSSFFFHFSLAFLGSQWRCSGVTPGSALRNYSCWCLETLCDAGDRTWLGRVQGKRLPCCTITPAPNSSRLTEPSVRFSETSCKWQHLRYLQDGDLLSSGPAAWPPVQPTDSAQAPWSSCTPIPASAFQPWRGGAA